MGEKIALNNDWKFYPEMLGSDTREWESVRIPHTFCETPYHYFDESCYQMVGIYEKAIRVPEEWKDKQIYLCVDGAAHELKVSVNGFEKGSHSCGYTRFRTEITDELVEGENLIRLRVDSRESLNQPPFGFVVDYMTYGGIYREVYLEVMDRLHTEDLFIVPERLSDSSYHLHLQHKTRPSKIQLILEVTYQVKKDGEVIAEWKELYDSTEGDYSTMMTVEGIEEWHPDHPTLYEMVTTIERDGVIHEVRSDRFGFRKAEFKADGFYLNEKKFKLRGLNRHQSYAYVGYAMPDSMQKLDAEILKNELGLNAVRTSHYPQSHAFLEKCDELGLLVFTEMPGWQHIGDEEWKKVAIKNVEDMVLQYRNHPSIILWGVRINESADDDDFYKRTNEKAHSLDPSRATGGVRAMKGSHLLEDVYTYNDFSHNGKKAGCEPKNEVTKNPEKAYLISEYNGHMFPTKNFDAEEHRLEHLLRHARVINDVAKESDIAGSFGWCAFDYNTHKDFGSGDRICYHGVMDMFRNPKPAAFVYACEGLEIDPMRPEETTILELSSTMDIGEHPACNRGPTYILTNADSVKMYKNDIFLKEYKASDTEFQKLKHGPILIDDFVGNQIREQEDFTPAQADIITKAINYTAVHGYDHYPLGILLGLARCLIQYRMNMNQAVVLYNKYVGDWGGEATSYRLEAIKDGKVVKTLIQEPMTQVILKTEVSSHSLYEKETYDVALVRIKAVDQNGNLLPFYQEPITLKAEGMIEIIGPHVISLKGGMGGVYVKTLGMAGEGRLILNEKETITWNVQK